MTQCPAAYEHFATKRDLQRALGGSPPPAAAVAYPRRTGSQHGQHRARAGRDADRALHLRQGPVPGSGPWALTLAPAVLGTVAITAGLALTRIPGDIDRRPRGKATGSTTLRRTLGRIGHLPAAAGRGARVAIMLLRRREPGLLGAPVWWGFDIAVLWASFHAFGEPPPVAVLVLAYFVGMLGNLLPL